VLHHAGRALRGLDREIGVQLEVERHRCCAVHDLVHALRERAQPATQTEARARDVAANRRHPSRVGVTEAEQARQRALDPGRGCAVVGASHQHVHISIRALQVARQQFHADESRGAGEQHPVRSGFLVTQLRLLQSRTTTHPAAQGLRRERALSVDAHSLSPQTPGFRENHTQIADVFREGRPALRA